jgi:hypothetical protein
MSRRRNTEPSRAKALSKTHWLGTGNPKLILLVCLACFACFLPSAALAQAQYAGTYSGTFSGDASGTWHVTIDGAGNVTGYANTPAGRVYADGQVTSWGSVFGSVDIGASFSGQIGMSGHIQGTWAYTPEAMYGTFSGNRGSPSSSSPKVTITSPKANSRLTDSWIPVEATATSSTGIQYVEMAVSNAWSFGIYWQLMYQSDFGAWYSGADLAPGLNLIMVRATDWAGVESSVVAVKVTYVVSYPVWLTVDPPEGGTVTGVTNGAMREAGKQYTAKATPKPGYLFGHWSFGISNITNPTLKFTMPPEELYLFASFALNPFASYAGTYSGLYQSTGDPESWTDSGLLNLVLSDKGMASGKIMSKGASYSFSAVQFDPLTLSATFQVKRGTRLPPLQVSATIGAWDPVQPYLMGSVGDGLWVAELSAGRRSSVSGLAGKYTFGLGADVLGGYGAGTITVDQRGVVTLGGNLGDGTPVTLSSQVAQDGSWPIYIPIYGGKGVVAGWGSLQEGIPSAVLYWMKPSKPTDKYYPEGFNTTDVYLGGALYVPPAPGQQVTKDWTSGWVELGAGNLTGLIQNEITLSNNKVTVVNNSAKLRLTLTPSSGRFTGSFTDPVSLRSRYIKGAIIQDAMSSYGIGWFLGGNESGYLYLAQSLSD